MTPEIAICLVVLAVSIVLFAWDRIPAEVIALGVMLSLVLTGLLQPAAAFAGFASDTVMMILGLLIMTAGLGQTGLIDAAGRAVFEFAGRSQAMFLPTVMLAAAVFSAFMSNTAATAFFIPLVLGYAAKTRTSASDYLMPLAFAAILSSSVTLISTSTNLVVSQLLTGFGQPPIGMFEMAPVGIPIAAAGLLYTWAIGARLLPRRSDQRPTEPVGERKYQADVVVVPDSPFVGSTIDKTPIGSRGLTVVKVLREGQWLDRPEQLRALRLQEGDEIALEGMRADLLDIKNISGIEFKADAQLSEEGSEPDDMAIVEGVLMPNSPLIGRSLRRLDFKSRYGLQVLAIHRLGPVPAQISDARLRMGDVLLLQGTPADVQALERGNLFNIFGGIDRNRLNPARAPLAAAIFTLAILAATFDVTALPVAVLGGAFAMLLTRCLAPEEAYRQVEWKVIILIGSLLSLGAAMETSGAGKYLAAQLLAAAGTESPYVLLSCFFVLTVLLTQPMSNQAAALVVLPVAIQTAVQTGADPRPFAMMVAVSASCSYLTPLEPSCLMVYGPGKYRFLDFFRVGLPLTVLIFVIAIVLVPRIWPL